MLDSLRNSVAAFPGELVLALWAGAVVGLILGSGHKCPDTLVRSGRTQCPDTYTLTRV